MKTTIEAQTIVTELVHRPIEEVASLFHKVGSALMKEDTISFICRELFINDINRYMDVHHQMDMPSDLHIQRVSMADLNDFDGYSERNNIKETWAGDFVLLYAIENGVLKALLAYTNGIPLHISTTPNLSNCIKLSPEPFAIEAVDVADDCVNVIVAYSEYINIAIKLIAREEYFYAKANFNKVANKEE